MKEMNIKAYYEKKAKINGYLLTHFKDMEKMNIIY